MQVSYAASTHNVPSVVTQVAGGCFRSIDQHDVLLTRESHLELLGSTPAVPSDHQGLAHESLFIQPIHGAIRDLAVLPPLVCLWLFSPPCQYGSILCWHVCHEPHNPWCIDHMPCTNPYAMYHPYAMNHIIHCAPTHMQCTHTALTRHRSCGIHLLWSVFACVAV